MSDREVIPGISRDDRLSDEGLQRLEKQLQHGACISDMVLRQWVKRYGDAAKKLLARYGRLPDEG